jgi:hypothetical protein
MLVVPCHAVCCCPPLQAIRSDNPIIFFEHVLLYNIKGETHDGDYCQSLEKAEVGAGGWRAGRTVGRLWAGSAAGCGVQAVGRL